MPRLALPVGSRLNGSRPSLMKGSIMPPTADPNQPRRRWRWLAALLLLLLVAGIVWAVRPDQHLARAQELQQELFSPDSKNLPADERKAKFTELREEMKHLTDDQKWELSAPMREKQKAD